MMNRDRRRFFLFSRRPGEYLPLFWLAGAFVLGFLWSLAYASGLVAEEPLPWPAGRLMFAFYGHAGVRLGPPHPVFLCGGKQEPVDETRRMALACLRCAGVGDYCRGEWERRAPDAF